MFLVFLGVWYLYWVLNRPEPMYSNEPLSYWMTKLSDPTTAEQAARASQGNSATQPSTRPMERVAQRTAAKTIFDDPGSVTMLPTQDGAVARTQRARCGRADEHWLEFPP